MLSNPRAGRTFNIERADTAGTFMPRESFILPLMRYRPLTSHAPRTGILLLLFHAVLACSAFGFSGDVWRDATLYRDEWGIPHVYADTPFAMAFVFGYAQAEDHCEHMLLAYRMANGSLAEVLGAAYADSDAFSLKMGHARLAKEVYPTLDPVTREICEGFSMGVNAWISDHVQALPSWVDGMLPEDVLALWHAFLMSMAPFELPNIYRRPPAIPSSNAWAASPNRSSEGKAVLVMNPHQQHDGFFQWYEAHLVLGGINLYGATLRGLPVIIQGHNEHLGWAFSPNQSDFADMFREDYKPANRNPKELQQPGAAQEEQRALLLHYMANSAPYRVRTAGGMETRYVPALIGVRGPMFEHPELGLHSWYIGGYRDFGGLRQLLEMGASATLDQFTAALSFHQIPCFHIVYADQSGNIFYLYNTKSGVRIAPRTGQDSGEQPVQKYNWAGPQPYDLASMAWRAVFLPDALPCIVNPPSGFVQACGNPPWTATAPGVLSPEAWPEWLVLDRDSFRAKRLRQLLREGQRSFRDHQSILFDVLTPAALELVPALLRSVETRGDLVQAMHPDFQSGIQLLRDWNYTAETTSTGMTFYHLWLNLCLSHIAKNSITEEAFYAAAVQNAPDAQEVMLKAVEDAAITMRNEYGTLEKPWGSVHVICRGTREEPIPGSLSGGPLFVASDQQYDKGKWVANYGYGFAMAVQFGDVVESVSLTPFGQSQVAGTAHYDDQLNLLVEKRFKHARFLPDDILRNAELALGKNITLFPKGVTGAVTLLSDQVINARATTAIDAPHSIPPGMAPFSLYVQMERKPAGVPVTLQASLQVPAALCDDTAFQRLTPYRFEPGLGWTPAVVKHMDVKSRIFLIEDASLAEWYVILGPVESALKAAAISESAGTPQAREAQIGLDALLNEHAAQPVITGRGKLFHLERHDQKPFTDKAETDGSETGSSGEGTFKLERLDQSTKDTGETIPAPLRNIPGFVFGPATREPGESKAPEQAVSVPNGASTPPEAAPEPGDNAVQVTPETPPSNVDTPETGTIPEAPPPTPAASPDTSTQPRERPPLPDVIPKDSGFVFGPSKEESPGKRDASKGNRVFNIKRMD